MSLHKVSSRAELTYSGIQDIASHAMILLSTRCRMSSDNPHSRDIKILNVQCTFLPGGATRTADRWCCNRAGIPLVTLKKSPRFSSLGVAGVLMQTAFLHGTQD